MIRLLIGAAAVAFAAGFLLPANSKLLVAGVAIVAVCIGGPFLLATRAPRRP